MSMLSDYNKANRKMHLQGIGLCDAIPANELKVGMYLSWNCSPNGYVVESIREATPKFLEIVEKSRETGKTNARRLKKDRLVVAEMPK